MRKTAYFFGVVSFCILSSCLVVAQNVPKDPPMPMSFFITSAGPGDGGNLGGLAGADAPCRKLAVAAGGAHNSGPAYLSTQSRTNQTEVKDRDSSRQGPWYHAKGTLL